MKTKIAETLIESFISQAKRFRENTSVNIRQVPRWKVERLNRGLNRQSFLENGFQKHTVGFSYSITKGGYMSYSHIRALNRMYELVGSKNAWGYFSTQEFVRGNEECISVIFVFLAGGMHPDDVWKVIINARTNTMNDNVDVDNDDIYRHPSNEVEPVR